MWRDRLERSLVAALLLGVLGLGATGWVHVLAARGTTVALERASSGALALPSRTTALVVGLFLLSTAAALVFRPGLVRRETLAGAVVLVMSTFSLSSVRPLGLYLVIAAVAAVAAISIGLAWPDPRVSSTHAAKDRRTSALLWAAAAAAYAAFSMHRHFWFGSGSWDMGCMVHNVYRASRFLDTTSTVLGDVDFLGDHFMIGIYLLAPIFWVSASGYALLLVQSLSLAAIAPAIYLIARGRGASPAPAAVLSASAALAFGMQSAAYFDSHEITLGFGFLAWALWAFEKGRLRTASALLLVFALFKESLGAYVVGLGLLAIWRGLAAREARLVRFGAAWIGFGAAWFILVNRVFMPLLRAGANAPEPHETFADFGPTVFAAALGILKDPLKACFMLFVPEEKMISQAVTLGGFGWLPLLAPEILIPALPLIAERFLSSKTTMWEMGYHYAAPLTLYAAWAVAIAWPRLAAITTTLLDGVAPGHGARAARILALYLALSTLLINALGYHHPANFHRWREDYFSTEARREAHARAVELIGEQGREARLAAQNRLLPHVADRPHIYRLGDWKKADFVLLSIGESAWPWDEGYPARIAREIDGLPEWRLVFSQHETAVFARASTGVTAVAPSRELALRAGVKGTVTTPRAFSDHDAQRTRSE